MAAWFKVSFNELLWHLYLSNTFYYILVQLDWPVIYPPQLPRLAFFGGERRNVPTLLSQGCVCISLLCLVDEKGTHSAGSQGPYWLAGAGLEGTAVGAWKVGGRLSWSWAAHEFRCRHRRPPCSLPSAPWVWVFLSGLLSCMTLIWIRWQ